ncbi:MAG: tetratricopeptide repeat protein [Chloroflexi bacterium]|nr:tetratricopeptide repeat protein [Chloroflexota bacterium]
MPIPPTGTVTFLFTDIEGSTRLAQQFPAAWPGARARHHAILKSAIESRGGYVFQVIGDAFCAAFHTAPDAIATALDAQRALYAEPWGDAVVRIRVGVHTGAATARPDGDYEGYLTLVRVQRIMSGAYGGQVLLSQSTAELVGDAQRDGVGLRDLGTHRLKDLGAPEHLHQLIMPGLPADFPPLKTADHPNNLPTQLTSFIGREAEVAEVRHLLDTTRLLTLMGAGGVGKTRLALQVAAEELVAFPDGVWFVELAPLADPALVPSTIASAVGVREEPRRPMLATLGDHFRAKTALIVLDNCEHLIADAAQVCDTLLHAAPHLTMIATSREALGIAGERAYRVPSLGIPAATMPVDALSHVASVQLFSERARAAKTDFALTSTNAPAVAQICRRLDGIPLAIELAAARIKALSPEQIAARLDDRFRLLTGGSRTAMPRQQTLRAAVDWSYSLLSEPERTLMRRLAVFAGGWTLEAAEAVCADDGLQSDDVLDLLMHLADKSLVVVETTEDAVRYRMLETVRQYAREKLFDSGEGAQLRKQHLNYFRSLAQSAEPHLNGAEQGAWLCRLDMDVDNLRSAIDWGREGGEALTALQLVTTLGRFWLARGYSDGIERLRRGIASAETAGPLPPDLLARGRALRWLGLLLWGLQGRYSDARPVLAEAVAIATKLDDHALILSARAQLGRVLAILGEHDEAHAQLEENLRLAHVLTSAYDIGWTLDFLGELHLLQGNLHLAEQAMTESVSYAEESGDLLLCSGLDGYLGRFALEHGELKQAEERFRRCLQQIVLIGMRWRVPISAVHFAALALAHRQYERSARLLGACMQLSETMEAELNPMSRILKERVFAELRAQMEPKRFDLAWSGGRAMSYDEVVAYALEGSDA